MNSATENIPPRRFVGLREILLAVEDAEIVCRATSASGVRDDVVNVVSSGIVASAGSFEAFNHPSALSPRNVAGRTFRLDANRNNHFYEQGEQECFHDVFRELHGHDEDQQVTGHRDKDEAQHAANGLSSAVGRKQYKAYKEHKHCGHQVLHRHRARHFIPALTAGQAALSCYGVA